MLGITAVHHTIPDLGYHEVGLAKLVFSLFNISINWSTGQTTTQRIQPYSFACSCPSRAMIACVSTSHRCLAPALTWLLQPGVSIVNTQMGLHQSSMQNLTISCGLVSIEQNQTVLFRNMSSYLDIKIQVVSLNLSPHPSINVKNCLLNNTLNLLRRLLSAFFLFLRR